MKKIFTKENVKRAASETIGAVGESFSALMGGGLAAMGGIKAGLKVGSAGLTAVTVAGATAGTFVARGVGRLVGYLTAPSYDQSAVFYEDDLDDPDPSEKAAH